MDSDYIEIIETIEELLPEKPAPRNDFGVPLNLWFTDAGITPNGRCWVSPTDEFYKQWLLNERLAARLKALGFEGSFDCAWCEFVFFCPPNMKREAMN